jgi:hypothetical protein
LEILEIKFCWKSYALLMADPDRVLVLGRRDNFDLSCRGRKALRGSLWVVGAGAVRLFGGAA